MGEINLPREEHDAIRSIEVDALRTAIDRCLDTRRMNATMRDFRLDRCGLYVAAKLREFEASLADYAGAKAWKKVADTGSSARRAGGALTSAVEQMQDRVEAQAQESQRFFINDRILPPLHFDRKLAVSISYRWRPSLDADWIYGSITFLHIYDPPPDYRVPVPKRKPSARQQERDLQDELFQQWDHFRHLGLYSLLEYFRLDRDGADIPMTFQARTDDYRHALNNFSCRFWS